MTFKNLKRLNDGIGYAIVATSPVAWVLLVFTAILKFTTWGWTKIR
jgi:hypothetical protein